MVKYPKYRRSTNIGSYWASNMPFLFKKKSRGKIYWYIGENKRVKGKVVRAWETYVGTAESILDIIQNSQPKLKEIEVLKFGAVAAVFSILQRLKVRELVNQTISPKRDQGIDLGLFTEVMIINRCIDPKSKTKHNKWYQSTFLKHYQPIQAKNFRSQRFWDHMSYFTEDRIEKLEETLVSRIIQEFDIQLDCLLYDPTNFSTYCRSHKGLQLAKHGASKAKRFDLLQINLALLTTREDGIPLFHHTYPGNINDPTEFKEVLPVISKRYEAFHQQGGSDLTIVFDKGNNSESGLELVRTSKYHFVGSLRPSTQKELLEIPIKKYNETWEDNLEGKVHAHRITKQVYKNDYILVLTYSKAAAKAANKALTIQLEAIELELQELDAKIGLPYYRKESSLETKIQKIVSKKSIKGLFKAELKISQDQKDDRQMKLVWSKDEVKINLKKQSFGKRILFTDQTEWSSKEIIEAYRSQWRIERDFHELKSPDLIRVTPMHHWTDNKIRIHLFICVMALMVQRLLHREIKKDFPNFSIDDLWSNLDSIYKVGYLFTSGKNTIQYKLSKLTKMQQVIVDRYNLTSFMEN